MAWALNPINSSTISFTSRSGTVRENLVLQVSRGLALQAISYPSSAHNDWHRNVLRLDSLPHGHAGQFCTQARSCTTQLVDYCSCCIWNYGQVASQLKVQSIQMAF
ncbi:hypothetical protein WJX79_007861 [Trebouxia sp. C0005]